MLCNGGSKDLESVVLHTRSAWLRAAAPVAVLALALTACGGNKDASSSAPTPGSGADDGKNSADAVAAADEKSPQSSEAPEPSGGVLRPGRSGTGQYKEESGKTTYEVVAQKVHVGTEAEARKVVQSPEDAKGLVAVTAYVKFTNKGPGIVKGLPKVDNGTEIYADGQRGGLLIGAPESLPGCEDPIDIDNWQVGESHIICQTYMIPEHSTSLEVHWGEEGTARPFIWKFDGAG
ncbi:lipoprotein [Streptomyces sp. 769]|nr:lipoprotein [Streptomyces sp. 769]